MNYQIKLFLVFLFSSVMAFAQNSGVIEGKIISSDGFPVSGVTIKMGKSHSSTITNENGEFHFSNFPEGHHTLTLEGEG